MFEKTSVGINEKIVPAQKGTAADLTIRAADVFCAIKPQRKMLPLFNIKMMHLEQTN